MAEGAQRIALVTGGGRNIGREICLALGRRGFDIAVNVRTNLAEAEEVVGVLDQMGRRGVVVAGDVSRRAEASSVVQAALAHFGRVDAVVNTVSIRAHKPFLEIEKADWQETFDANVGAAFHVCQAVLPGMVDRRHGSIVHVSGSIAFDGGWNPVVVPGVHLAAAKAAVLGLTHGLAREFGGVGIRVNAVIPTAINTKRATPLTEEILHAHEARAVLGRLGEPHEIAEACAFLASDESSYITGQSVHVNGGALMT